MKSIEQYWVSMLTAWMVFCLVAPKCEATAKPFIRLNESQKGDFRKALASLAEQGHVAIVAEGVPLRPHLLPQDAAKLVVSPLVDDAVTAVAGAYDYTAQREGEVFVLKKRYFNPDDLPALTQSECEKALVSIKKVAAPFNPHAQSVYIRYLAHASRLRRDQYQIVNPPLDMLAASLTPNQLELMRQNRLCVSTLSGDQQALVQKLQLYLYVQEPIETVDPLLTRLTQVERSGIFHWQDTDMHQHVFGYNLPTQLNDRVPTRFHPLSYSTGLEDLGIIDLSAPSPLVSDPTDPSTSIIEVDASHAQTLESAVVALNSRHDGPQIDVDATVTAIPVTLIGSENAPMHQVLRGLADACSLRLTDAPLGISAKSTLTLPDATPPSALLGLPPSLRQALPGPFARAIHLDRIVSVEEQFYNLWQPTRDPKIPLQTSHTPNSEEALADLEQAMQTRKRAISGPEEFNAGQEQIKQMEAALPALRIAAIRRLRALVEPKLRAKPNGIALSELGEAEHEAMAVIFLVEATQSLIKLLTQAPPESVLHLDRAVLAGGVHTDVMPPVFSISFNALTSDGRVQASGGGMAAEYIKDYGKDDKK